MEHLAPGTHTNTLNAKKTGGAKKKKKQEHSTHSQNSMTGEVALASKLLALAIMLHWSNWTHVSAGECTQNIVHSRSQS